MLLVVLAAVLLPLLVPREKLRTMAEERAREMTGGEVSLGELSLSVFPRLKLVLGESEIRVDREGLRSAGQQPGPLLAAEATLEKLEVDLALLPLLRQQFEFGEVRLIRPRASVTTEPPAAAPDDTVSAPSGPGQPSGSGGGAGVGLALAAVEVRDGELTWTEEGTGRRVTVLGWQQDMAAPSLGALMQRLQRLGGMELPPDDHGGAASLELETTVASVTLTGFSETAIPPLQDLRLRGSLAVPAAADRADVAIAELAIGEFGLTADVVWTRDRVEVAALELTGAEAVTMSGRAAVTLPPARGPLTIDLDGRADLSGVLALAAPWMPAGEAGARPLPELSGTTELELTVDLAGAPVLSDAAAWQEAWDAGLDGHAEARVMGGPLRIEAAQLDQPVDVASVTLVSDLTSSRGRTRARLQGLEHPAARGDASIELTLPPAAGPLMVEASLAGDLARVMTTAQAVMPPRAPEAAPMPEVQGQFTASFGADLATAPSLADTAAWQAAWRDGLDGTVSLAAQATKLRLVVPQLGEPLTVARVDLTSDLRSPRGRSKLTATTIRHPILGGDGTVTVIPEAAGGATDVTLELDRLDLDALAEIARAQKEGGSEQARRLTLVPTARADASAGKPAVGELIPPDLAVDLDARVDEMRFLKAAYTSVEASGTLRERVIEVPSLSARLGSGRVDGSATIDYASDPYGRATWQANVQDAPASALLSPYAPDLAAIWTGALRADLTGSCDLSDPEAIRNSLTLEGDVAGTDGRIDLRDSLGGISQYLGSRQDLLRVVYDGVDQHLKIRDGKAHIEGLRVQGKETDWTGEGWISLDGRIDMGLHVKLPAGFTPDLGDLSFVAEGLRDEDGRIGLDLRLTGPSAKPKVSLDLDPAEMLQKEGLRESLEEEVKKGLGGLLDRLGGK
ncbi:hypothetical protein GF314_12785 [bacterium]|nr:hypothetical protein [bacterium]